MKRFIFSIFAAAALVALPMTSPAWAQGRGGGHGGFSGHRGAVRRGGFGGGHAGFSGRAAGRAASNSAAYGHAIPRGTDGRGGRGHAGHGYYGGGYYGGYGGGVYAPMYGWGWYDPFWYDGAWAYPYATAPAEVTGGLRLEIAPKDVAKDAQVFVDGYYEGVVDDFNGHFQHLDLTAGGHHVVVQAPGFAPLAFDTYIQPDHTTDFKGALQPVPAGD